MNIKAGDKLKLRGEDQIYVVVEWNIDRGLVSPVDCKDYIVGTELIGIEHIEKILDLPTECDMIHT